MTGHDLESRYRRLLAVYPWEHRRAYEDEMLAVLLAGARPGQRRPGVGDVLNLVASGLRARLRVTARGFTEPAWVDAAAATGLLVGLVLLALAGNGLVAQAVRDPSLPPPAAVVGPDAVDWLRVAGWAAVCAAALSGLRWLAAGLAWAAVVTWAALLSPQFATNPVYVVDTLPQFALAVVAAAALSVPAPRRRAVAVLGVRRLVTVVLALVAVGAVLLVNRLASPAFGPVGPTTVYVLYDLEAASELVIWLYVAGLAVAGLALLVALATLAAPLRRRVVVLLAPVGALAIMIDAALGGWAVSNVHMGHAIYLVPAQWTILVLVPVATFVAGVLLIPRREETLRMVALGRATDREQLAV